MASENVSSGPGARDAKVWSVELPPGAKAKSNWSEIFAERGDALGGPEGWGEGPWQGEPDRVEWRKADMPGIVMLAQRNAFGAWCGYVGVPPGNPAHGKSWSDIDGQLNVHRGLTYGAACEGHICHVPEPGEIEHLWWLGFDCNHAGDFAPGIAATLRLSARRRLQEIEAKVGPLALDVVPVDIMLRDTYRDFEYVRAETEQLAAQLFIAGMVGSLPPNPWADEESTISEKREP